MFSKLFRIKCKHHYKYFSLYFKPFVLNIEGILVSLDVCYFIETAQHRGVAEHRDRYKRRARTDIQRGYSGLSNFEKQKITPCCFAAGCFNAVIFGTFVLVV